MTQPGGAGTTATIDGNGFVHRTGNVNESVNGNKTFTGDGTDSDTVKVQPSGSLTTGSALNVNTGTSAPAAGNTQGFALNVTGSGSFASDNFVRIENSGTFTGTLVNLVANSTTSGTVLGISALSLTTGRAVDVQLAALYTGTSATTGAVNVQAGAFTGNIFSVSSIGTGQLASSNLANLTSQQLVGRLLYVNATGAYAGAGAVEITLNPTAGTPTGTALLVDAKSGFSGKFVDLQIIGTGSVWSVDATGAMTTGHITLTANSGITATAGTGAFDFSAATGTFKTSTGANTLGGDTTLAANKSLSAAAGTGAFNFSAATGTFDTTTGIVTLRGNTVLDTGKSLSAAGGASNFDFSASSGTFQTSTGANTLNGNTTVATGKTLTASQGVTTGTGTTLATGNGVTTGKALAIDTGTSAFSTDGAVSVTSSGNFTGTLTRLTANSTTAGTVLGVTATGLTTGKALQIDLGTALYTGTGAIDVTANTASTGTLLNVSGTALGANNGTGLKVATGTPTGTDPTVGKAIQVALGGAGAGTAYYANAATGYNGNFADYRVNGVSVFTLNAATGISTNVNFSQTGATTFGTGTGAVSLNGNTTVTGTNTLTIAAFTANGVVVNNASGLLSSLAPGTAGFVLTSNGTSWVSQIPVFTVLDRSTTTTSVANTTADTVIYSLSVPANTLGTTHQLRVTIGGTYENSTGASETLRVRVRYGGTSLWDDTTGNLTTSTSLRAWRLEFVLAANASTSAQKLLGNFFIGHANTTTAGRGDIGTTLGSVTAYSAPVYGTSAVNSTLAQTLEVRVVHSGADPAEDITREYVITELIQ